jgi:hypothetical protein
MHCKKAVVAVFLFFTFHFSLFTLQCEAALRDRVVAFVDNRAVTLSEFKERYKKTREAVPDISEEEVVNTMINRILLLREAKKYRIEAPTDDEVVKEYIDLKVRAFITVGENEMEAFYKQNISQFTGSDYDKVRGEIEKYLTEKELNERLKSMLVDLRKNASIKIQLKP